ncbi:helix-turn-helix domain-containing protein [Rhodococcus kroppenstedtii]|uniref:helix-turn-helix transcriptional regulator n=1 Tax=Rhodococcoides kroppenstedtii TaxID=293050 RepID=UPI002952A463|nr:helix-turn-helix domain-containing protein [Rhodococcus kroppenstedtii]MDV7196903.1 helix-turn-helix domain-containing protein [Rhodococcus kroppenstedtii]
MSHNTSELLTQDDVAEVCKVTARTVRGWIAAGYLPAVRIGPRFVRIRQDDLDRFIAGGVS